MDSQAAWREMSRQAIDQIRSTPPPPYGEGKPVRRVIVVAGRRSGRPRPFGINVTQVSGRLYLCSATRRRDWVRNLLHAGRCTIERDGPDGTGTEYTAVLVEGTEAARVLATCLPQSGYQEPRAPLRRRRPGRADRAAYHGNRGHPARSPVMTAAAPARQRGRDAGVSVPGLPRLDVPGDDAGCGDVEPAALVALLRGELAGSQDALARALEELAQARERIAELEARLRQSPRNSSRPPSSEGLEKPPPRPRSLRKKTGRRPGGQDGHQGTTLAQVPRPDREVRHDPARCGRCGGGLAGRPVTGVERRQVFDLPPVKAEVTEHQLIERECGCGHRTRAAAPEGADAPVQYGPRIAAIIVYLYTGQFLSKQRTAQALAELSGIPLSSGTVAAITTRTASRLGGFLEHAREQIAASDVAGFDETCDTGRTLMSELVKEVWLMPGT